MPGEALGALEGIRVLDLSRLAPGPYGSMLLGDMGAEVILVEEAGRPSGRRAGRQRPDVRGDNETAEGRRRTAYNAFGRNKRSIRINLKSAEGRELFYQLVDDADVVLEGYRPGVSERLGVDYATLSARNPRLVYCSISGYGQDGPYRDMVGHDINYIAMAGALGMIGRKGTPLAIPVNVIADYAGGGLMAAFAITVALLAREETGRGQYVDMAMTEGVMSLITGLASTFFADGAAIAPEEHRLNGGWAYYNVYETADGKWLSIGSVEPWFFARLCEILGQPEYGAHQYSTDAALRNEMAAYFRAQFKTKTRDAWFQTLFDEDICVAPVYSLSEAFADSHNRERGMVVELEAPGVGAVKQVGVAPKFSETPGRVRHTAPYPGQDTDAILGSLGVEASVIADLRAREVVA